MRVIRSVIWSLCLLALGFVFGYGTHTIRSMVGPDVSGSDVQESTPQPSVMNDVASSTIKNPPTPKAPVTIPVASLTDSQKALLSALGIDSGSITITPEMVTCAYGTIGEARIGAIVAGAKPTPLELIKAAPCLK